MTEKGLKRASYVMLTAPGLIVYAAVIIFPIMFSLVLSLTNWAGFIPLRQAKFDGLHQYVMMFKDPVFWFGLRNNLLIVAVSLFGQIPIGFVLAYILYRRLVKGGKFFETMIFLPITINPVVLALLWGYIFGPAGIVTAVLRMIYHNPRMVFAVFENKTWAIFPILIVILWVWTGLYMVIFIANLQKIQPSIIESAVIDGASEWQILGRVIFPAMVGVLFSTGVFAISGSLSSFNLIYAMTGGGPAHYTEVVAIYQYTKFFTGYHYGFGSAVAIVIVLLSVGLISILNAVFSRLEKRFS